MSLALRQPSILDSAAVDLTAPPIDAATSLAELASPTVLRRTLSAKRELRDARRAASCVEAIGPLDKTTEIYGFTKGQFSVSDIVSHCLEQTGPAFMTISTWTTTKGDVQEVFDLIDSGRLTGSRWLMDLSFNRRRPEAAHRVRTVFGPDAVRVAQNHAKFFLIHAAGWKVVCMTSMNLNQNPRFENFLIRNDPELFDFHQAICDEIWKRQPRSLAEPGRGKQTVAQAYFRGEM